MTKPENILYRGAKTYADKNDDYGDSWQKVGQILHLLAGEDGVTLTTPEEHVSYGLFTRRLDKLARAFHGEFFGDETNYEPTVDAHEDEMVYAAMHASLLDSTDERRRNRRLSETYRDTDRREQTALGRVARLSAKARQVQAELDQASGSSSSGATK